MFYPQDRTSPNIASEEKTHFTIENMIVGTWLWDPLVLPQTILCQPDRPIERPVKSAVDVPVRRGYHIACGTTPRVYILKQ